MNSDFTELLQEAEKLTNAIEGASELPKVERSLRQVLEDSQDLYARVAQSGSQDVQANILLGLQGVDLSQMVQKLETISTKRALEPLKLTSDTDIDSYLENYLQNVVVADIELTLQQCTDFVNKSVWEHQKAEWTAERMNIINSMITTSNDLYTVGPQPKVYMDSSLFVSNTFGSQEALYAAKVMEYNKSVMQGLERVNLITEFCKVAKDFKDVKVDDMWEMLKYVTELPPMASNENILNVRNDKQVIKILINQAKKYLEDRYKTYMTNVINENLAEARRGGVPGTYSLVKSFVGVRLQGEYSGLEGGLVDDKPLWPIVYYCLRCGDISAALHCLKKSTASVDDVIALLETKLKNPENSELEILEHNLQSEYRNMTHNSTDPFHRIVYDIICCANTFDEHSEVAKTADDYLWLKLSFMRINSTHDDSETYRCLQSTISEKYGEAHYNAANQPHVYFQMLILTGQFEAALEFLARTERYHIHSIHMAIALNELHLLALPRFPNAPLLCSDSADPKPSYCLNIARFIMRYVQKFEQKALKEAINYYFMLRNIDNNKQKMFVTCLIDLITETTEYELLFGKMQRTGMRSKGLLDEFVTSDITVSSIAQAAGEALVRKGLLENAVDLFDIASNHEEVLNLLCMLLSQVVHLQPTDTSRQQLAPKANEIASRYAVGGYNCSAKTVSSFTTLKDLLIFFDQYHTKQLPLALKTLNELQLVPLRKEELEERVSAFDRFNLDVCKVFPDIIMAAMNILFEQYQKTKSNEYLPSRYQDGSLDKQLSYLREQAKVLISFSGMLPYRMPGDTNNRLVQMEILMH